jgi:hypothetical protein
LFCNTLFDASLIYGNQSSFPRRQLRLFVCLPFTVLRLRLLLEIMARAVTCAGCQRAFSHSGYTLHALRTANEVCQTAYHDAVMTQLVDDSDIEDDHSPVWPQEAEGFNMVSVHQLTPVLSCVLIVLSLQENPNQENLQDAEQQSYSMDGPEDEQPDLQGFETDSDADMDSLEAGDVEHLPSNVTAPLPSGHLAQPDLQGFETDSDADMDSLEAGDVEHLPSNVTAPLPSGHIARDNDMDLQLEDAVQRDPDDNLDMYVEEFTRGRAGAPVEGRDIPANIHYQQTLSDQDNIYEPFQSKLDWELAHWAKVHNVSQNAFTDLLRIEGVSIRFTDVARSHGQHYPASKPT